jgi:hypothetical protein
MKVYLDEWDKDIGRYLEKASRMSVLYNSKCHLASFSSSRRYRPELKVFLDGLVPSRYTVVETIHPPCTILRSSNV